MRFQRLRQTQKGGDPQLWLVKHGNKPRRPTSFRIAYTHQDRFSSPIQTEKCSTVGANPARSLVKCRSNQGSRGTSQRVEGSHVQRPFHQTSERHLEEHQKLVIEEKEYQHLTFDCKNPTYYRKVASPAQMLV